MGDDSLRPEFQEPPPDDVAFTPKNKHYENSVRANGLAQGRQDFPFKTYVKHRDGYLDETLRLEGRGESVVYSRCAGCGTPEPVFRCANQTCFGSVMFCSPCIVERHKVLPTHWIEEWKDNFFHQRHLSDLGLVMQLGHPPGIHCPTSTKGHELFVLIDTTGIHKIQVRFCSCDSRISSWQQLMRARWWPATVLDPQTAATFAVIKLFQLLNCLGKVSAHDFMCSLELLTNNDGLNPVPNRRRAFRNIVRQYRSSLMMKRAGRGHDPSGVLGTKQGELALECRACPLDGKNVPDGWNTINWDEMPEDLRYKYFMYLSQDCNFRLINRDVSTAAKDPIVGDGFGYFVNHAKYTEFLRDHVTEEEISTCSGFQAMFLANRKRAKGLRTTGVGGVTCARHNMWRPNGIGDLQLGERQCNMDFILASAVLNLIIFYLILSYDIVCQYSKGFWPRMAELPKDLVFVLDKLRVWFKIPNFHLPGHKFPCHSPYSFHYMWGAGRTHGETVEQNWEFTNGAAASTKMMGLGARAATLEDLFGFHNWRRTVSWRGIFTKRMAENVTEGQVHRDAFDAFDAALRETSPELVAGWEDWVKDWESRQHVDGIESPFEVKEKMMSMKDIRIKLAKEELLRSGEGTEVEREDTPSTFVIMGLEIEESQRYLTIDVKALANPTEKQSLEFLKRRTALLKRIRTFRKMQRTYMPNLRRFLLQSQLVLWDSETEREAESIRLFMPSDIGDKAKREKACAVGLVEVEAELRLGEARDALESLRQGLRTRTMTNRFRLRNCTGQRALTRGQGVLRQVNVKIHKAKLRYRYARNALVRLRGHGVWEKELQVLKDEDSKRTLSWIWYQARSGEPTEQELVEALRVEWCKAYARMRRWHEDTVLVEEEMRRTIEYGYWAASAWLYRGVQRAGVVDEELEEGLRAYSLEQADREIRTSEMLTKKWEKLREKGQAFLARKTSPSERVVLPHDEGDVSDDDDEEGLPEDEEDEDLLE
ncbi:hypothetical protein B0H11DRAFT_2163296 [Mycena galericulata]|nr:hypothetical protein B0H11DRAFT_2163296 [Mycena galericulata]